MSLIRNVKQGLVCFIYLMSIMRRIAEVNLNKNLGRKNISLLISWYIWHLNIVGGSTSIDIYKLFHIWHYPRRINKYWYLYNGHETIIAAGNVTIYIQVLLHQFLIDSFITIWTGLQSDGNYLFIETCILHFVRNIEWKQEK